MRGLIEEMVAKGIELRDAVREFEKLYIEEAMRRSSGNATKAAGRLGVHRNTLRSKMTAKPKRRKARSRRPSGKGKRGA